MSELKQRLQRQVQADLASIEQALLENLQPQVDLVSQVAGHILFSGGKRLRPLLTVLCARICGDNGNHVINFSTIFEFIHAATLLHDDLVDDATIRRGQTVAHRIWDNPTAVLTGDFLLARSLSIAAQTKLPQVIAVVANITENMSQGEIQQLMRKGEIDLSEDEYMEVIRRKTAVLIQGACRTGAMVTGAAPKYEKALSSYGYNLGIAFQMADDLLDYLSGAQALGKAVGADLKDGKLTLPLIHTLSKVESQDRQTIERLIAAASFSDDEFEKLKSLIHAHGGVAYTRKLAEDRVAAAKQALSVFEASATRDLLTDLADYALVRNE